MEIFLWRGDDGQTMRNSIKGWTKVAFAALCISLFAVGEAAAFDVESDSTGNTAFFLLRNSDAAEDYQAVAVAVSEALPPFVVQASAAIVPASVAAGGSDLVSVEFDVSALALVGESADLEITISGTRSGQQIALIFVVPLEVVPNAPVAQGTIGIGVPVPEPNGVDSDGDGVSDALELNFGTDPNDESSVPGKPGTPAVPSLHLRIVVALVILLLLIGVFETRRIVGGVAQ
jgi:hypothetical protein